MRPTAQHPKVVVIGAGSLFFGRQVIGQMVDSPHLNTGTLALVDTDPERLDKMAPLARMVVEHAGVPLALEASTERSDVLADADFVVLSFADRSVYFRGLDCAVAEKHGVRMCSGDTIGPGGIFRAMRELPVVFDCARDVEALCPGAWVINYVNPTAVIGIGLKRRAPRVKSLALCDHHHLPHIKIRYAVEAGIIEKKEDYTDEIAAKFDLRIAGVNHFTWILKAEYDGHDVMGAIAESLRRAAETETADADAKTVFNNTIGYELYRAFGHVCTAVSHAKEYMPYWQGIGTLPESVPPLKIWETDLRYEMHDAMWRQVDDLIAGRMPIGPTMSTLGPDHATDIIESMVGGLGKPFYINTFNGDAVPNMAPDAFLELCCDLDMDGPRPRLVGEMPHGIRAMQQQALDTHELTAEAVATCDRAVLRRAMLTDPLVHSMADADAVIAELLEAERDALPACWFE
jgi:alpha-galactosidase